MKKVIYTCLFKDYEKLKAISYRSKEWDYICFTDSAECKEQKGWELIILPESQLDPTRESRYPKIMPHLFLEKYDYSLYIDANINIVDPTLYLQCDELISQKILIAANNHPKRNCIYKEAKHCIKRGKDYKETIEKQMEEFKENNYPVNWGLYENNIILRQHNKTVKLSEMWWEIIINYSCRDQLSLLYCLWKLNYKKVLLFENNFDVRNSKSFQYKDHPIPSSVKRLTRLRRKIKHEISKFLGFD